ncbi:MAG: hypothetical protein K1X67_19690 [Fimbriimonadaceae bacterium]|nr:hypothetical protein [Fimbriimonadaceae bacterium]
MKDQREQYRPSHLDDIPFGDIDDDFAQPLTTFPMSVEHHLAQAQQMLSRQASPAIQQAMEAVKTLANTSPEHSAMLVAATMGFREMSAALQDKEVRVDVDEHFVFGIKVGETKHTTTITKTQMKSIRLSK